MGRLATTRLTPSPAPGRLSRPQLANYPHRQTGAGTGDPDSVRPAPPAPVAMQRGRPWGEVATATGQPSRPNPTANLAGVPEGFPYRARTDFESAPRFRRHRHRRAVPGPL